MSALIFQPCRHLDYTEDKYGPDITLEIVMLCPSVKYWRRGPTWANTGEGQVSNPANVQFCKLRGRINGVFQCYNGEMRCYDPESEKEREP